MRHSNYSLYILRCGDDSLYTGIAVDVQSRLRDHQNGKLGAKYLRGRAPFALVFERRVGDRSAAQQVEHRIKRLPRQKKLALIEGDADLENLVLAQASGSSSG